MKSYKTYNYADVPSVERRVYWLFKGDEKRDLVIEFFIEDEENSRNFFNKTNRWRRGDKKNTKF